MVEKMTGKSPSFTPSNRIARTSGTIIIVFLWVVTFVAGLAFVFELGGISRQISDRWYTPFQAPPLYKTNYYGQPLKSDPYKSTSDLFLHPYYLFSLPWRETDRQRINNDYVQLDKHGFRINPHLATAGKTRAVLLGGSTAFSKFSSSDLHTISAELTAKTGIGFVNRNAPGWKSHQELVALAKYSEEYALSISFSFSNDMAGFCKGEIPDIDVVDAPSSYYDLQRIFDANRDGSSSDIPAGYSLTSPGKFLKRVFPDTARLIRQVDNPFGTGRSRADDNGERCKDKDVTPVVDAFLRNQTAMAQLSSARGATHIVVIQPSYSMHTSSDPEHWTRAEGEIDFRRRAIAKLLAHPSCAQRCYDFSTLFDRLGGASHLEENTGTIYVPRIFEGDVHLTDTGVDLLTQELAKIVTSLPMHREISRGLENAQSGSN